MSSSVNMDLLNALAAQLGREKVVAMCEAFLSSGADKQAKKVKKVPAPAAASDGEDDKDKPKRQLPLKLVQWQSFVRYCKEKFSDRFEGVKGAPAMQQLCKTLKEEEGVWADFEGSWVAPEAALPPLPAAAAAPKRSSPGPAAEGEETEDEAAPEAKPKRKWSEEAKASAAAKRAAKKALKGAKESDSESVASAGSAGKAKEE